MTIPCGCVVIDTNVFEHLLTQENTCGHITALLTALTTNKAFLLVDSDERIEKEYLRLLERSGVPDKAPEMSLLKLWLGKIPGAIPRVRVAVDHGDSLMEQIKSRMRHPPKGRRNTDRIFVYVALRRGRPLISNDDYITKKKSALLKIKGAKKGADILTSKQAAARV